MRGVSVTIHSAVIAVDLQNDFCPGGALPVPEGDTVVPVMNLYIARFSEMGLPVFFTKDWHPLNHVSFKTAGGVWPDHCIQDTHGAKLHPGLLIPGDAVIIEKGTAPNKDAYSAFEGTSLNARLRKDHIERLFIGGLATDYCVKHTVLDALHAGFEVFFLSDVSKGVDVNRGDSEEAIDEMLQEGAVRVIYKDIIWQPRKEC